MAPVLINGRYPCAPEPKDDSDNTRNERMLYAIICTPDFGEETSLRHCVEWPPLRPVRPFLPWLSCEPAQVETNGCHAGFLRALGLRSHLAGGGS